MKTKTFIKKVLVIVLKVVLFLFFVGVSFYLLNKGNTILNITGAIILILDVTVTARHLLIKFKQLLN